MLIVGISVVVVIVLCGVYLHRSYTYLTQIKVVAINLSGGRIFGEAAVPRLCDHFSETIDE